MTNQTIDGVPLLPCPFCGCQVTLLTGREDYRIAGSHSKACPFLDVDVFVDSRSAWNSRADQPAPVAAVLPERMTREQALGLSDYPPECAMYWWNACLNEVTRLNKNQD